MGGRLNLFQTDHEGRVSINDLRSAFEVIRHRPSDEHLDVLLGKLDVDGDGYVPLQEIVALAEGEGLGIVIHADDAAEELVEQSGALLEGRDDAKDSATAPTPPSTSPTGVGAPQAQLQDVPLPVPEKKKDEKPKEEKKLKKEDVVEG